MKVVVTGAAGDIGATVVETLKRSGMTVIEATHANCDVRSLESVRAFMLSAWNTEPASQIEGLVVCHGAPAAIKSTQTLTDDEFMDVLLVDLLGTLRVCREAKRYGPLQIVILSSIHAIATYPERAAYATAKAGVVGLARALAVEWARDGTRVNCVLPGQVAKTKRTEGHPTRELLKRTPTCKLVTKHDVAHTVLFLLIGRGVNGEAIVVDGGYTASAWYKPHDGDRSRSSSGRSGPARPGGNTDA